MGFFNYNCSACRSVREALQPVVVVTHGDDDDWCMLCAYEHPRSRTLKPARMRELAERDPTLDALADLPIGFGARRAGPDAPWVRAPLVSPRSAGGAAFAAQEHECIEDVRRFGLHVVHVEAGEQDDGFSYSVGLWARYEHAELVVFGESGAWQAAALAEVAGAIRGGARFGEGSTFASAAGSDFRFHRIWTPASYREYLGWGVWYYSRSGSNGFPALQLIWPGPGGAYPGSPAYRGYRQPILE